MVMNVITIVCVVVLVVMALNLILVLIFGQGLPYYLDCFEIGVPEVSTGARRSALVRLLRLL